MEEKRVRVSIANLAWSVRTTHGRSWHPFGIVNQKKLAKGERWYGALGGGVMLTQQGKEELEHFYGASDFEFDAHSGFFDARFQVDEETDLEGVFSMFPIKADKAYEQDPTLDIVGELTGSEPGHESIFTADEAKMIEVIPVRVVRQKPAAAGADTSGRASSDIPTLRLFRIFELAMPYDLFEKMLRSPAVRLFSSEELATTDGGSKAGRTNDGCVIQNNLFPLQ